VWSSDKFQICSTRLTAVLVDFDAVFEPVALLDFFQTSMADAGNVNKYFLAAVAGCDESVMATIAAEF
jgi:hypothetical protein